MIALEKIDSKELKVAVNCINEMKLVEKMRTVGVSKADQISKFTEAFEKIQEENEKVLLESGKVAIDFFNKIYADEAEEGTTEETKVEEKKEEESKNKEAEEKAAAEAKVKEEEKAKKAAEKEAKKEEAEKAKAEKKAQKEAAAEAKAKEKRERIEKNKETRKGLHPDQAQEVAKKRYELINKLVGESKYTKKEIIELVCKEFPTITPVTVATNLCDSKNPKYNRLEKLAKEVEKEGKVVFVFVD